MGWDALMTLGGGGGAAKVLLRYELEQDAASGSLEPGVYVVFDEGRLAAVTGPRTYALMERLDERDDYGFQEVQQKLDGGQVELNVWLLKAENRHRLSTFLNTAFFADQASYGNVSHALFDHAGAFERLILSGAALQALYANHDPEQGIMLWDRVMYSAVLGVAETPVMTGFDSSRGRVSASSTNGAYHAWHAFDGTANIWIPDGSDLTDQWLRYDFDEPVFIHTCELTPGDLGGPKVWRLEYSDDGRKWRIGCVVVGYQPQAGVKTEHMVLAPGRHRYWRLFSQQNQGFGSINELRLRGFV